MENFKSKLKNITTFIFDVDGVLTNGMLTLFPNGEMVRQMNIKDGYAMQYAIGKGFRIAIISGGKSNEVINRLNLLGVKDVFMGKHDKVSCYTDYLNQNNISEEEVLYMGDDIPDYHVMKRVGVAACPNDAVTEIKNISIYVSDKKGGEGCVRDLIEQVMRVKGLWEV